MAKKLLKQSVVWIAALAVMLAAAFIVLPQIAGAAGTTVGAFTVTGGTLDTDYTYAGNVLTILSSTAMTISGTTDTDRIVVAANVSANITLDGVDIDLSGTGCIDPDAGALAGSAAFEIVEGSSGNVTITLAENSTNELKGGIHCAGLQKKGTNGALIITGTGSLAATGGYGGAGIGGDYGGTASNITINGGVVTATGGDGGAGIGGGLTGNASDIKITGGSVKAVGTSCQNASAPDIGSGVQYNGSYTNGSPVTPKNGTGAGAKEVYLYTINADGAAVTIDGSAYPTKHADNDANVYAYLTGGDIHEVKVGSETKRVAYNSTMGAFEEVGKDLTVTATEAGTTLKYGEDYTYPKSTGVLTILSDTAMTISGTTDTDRIVVAVNVSANITLDGVNIDLSGTGGMIGAPTAGYAAFDIAENSEGNVTITLAENSANALKGGVYRAGLQKNGAYISTDKGKLTINGSGTLEATGGLDAAGIGGGYDGSTGYKTANITIEGSTKVTATGGDCGAGIGGGSICQDADHITIGGNAVVIATGGSQGAGIGSGAYGTSQNITIGGNAVVTAKGAGGAGIGNGAVSNADGLNVVISGGSVKAEGGTFDFDSFKYIAPAIGAGNNGMGGSYSSATPKNGTSDEVYLLTIANPNGENVYIDSSAAAYTPKNHSAADSADTNLYVYLTGTNHTVKVGESGKVMTYVFNSTSNTFDLLGGDLVITATATDAEPNPAAPVNGIDYTYLNGVLTIKSDKAMTIKNAADVTTTTDTIFVEKNIDANLTLAGVNIDVSKKANTAAFKIADDSEGNVTITTTTANTELKSGENCAGLEKNGEFISEDKGKLTIIMSGIGPTVTGGKNGAGIGGGNGKTGSNIIITAATQYGDVIATGGQLGAGIGGGNGGAGTNITISGGRVTANSGGDSAGIGGGTNGVGSDITITGGTVNTTGSGGAGIGGGFGTGGTGSNITISGGVVTAQGRYGGAGIGGGFGNTANGIVISGGSVKAIADEANAIGGGKNQEPVPPKNAAGDKVYLLTIANPDGADVYIDGSATAYTPKNHSGDTNLYVYLTGERHTVKVGSGEEEIYIFNPLTNTFKKPDLTITATKDGESLTYGTDYEYYGTILEIKTSKAVTISGTTATTTDTIYVYSSVTTANITLNGVNIDVSDTENAFAFAIGAGCSATITLTGDNSLKSGVYRAGLHKGGGDSTLTITGTGSLTAIGGFAGAGIGGDSADGTSNITISGSAVVTAIGGYGGAGIGGGALGSCGTVTIGSDASVKAEGSTAGDYRAPAIGSGVQNNANGTPVTPKNSEGKSVYLLKIETDGTSDVYVDNIKLPHKTHNGENAVYAYVTGAAHTVKLGADGEEVEYKLCGTGADAKFKIVPKAEDFTFSAPANLTYNGSSIEATVTTDVAEIGTITVKYYGESGDELSGAPVVPGDYTVKIDVAEGDTYANAEDITAESWKFTIIKATPDSPDKTSFTLDLTVDSDNMYTATVNTDLEGVEYSFDGTTWSDTNSKTGIGHNTEVTAYIRFKVSDVSNGSDSASKTKTTAHGNVTSEWSKDAQGHWHACANCPNDKLDFAQHTSSGAATVGKAETCTICGYEINPAIGVTAAPVITPNGGTFTGTQAVTITCATEGATIYYTTDGATPTTASNVYSAAITLDKTATVKAIAVKDGMADSTVTTATFTKKSSGGGNGGGHSSNYPISTNPTINGVSKSWSDIANELSKLAADSEVTIELNGNYEVPVEVIKAIADKNLKVTFVIDSWRSWTIDGADIEKPAAADFSAIQLPSSAIDGSSLRGTVGARLRIDGTNNPTALTVSFNKKYAGEFANLYRKDGDKLVFVDTVKIDENGSAQLEITDGGDYIFMLCEYSDRPGDMNNDGKLTAADASTMLKYIVRLIDDGNVQMADLNGDGKINARDAVIVLKKVVGLA